MRTSVERNDAGVPLELVDDDEGVLRLEPLHGVARENAAGESRGQAEVARLVVTRIARARLDEVLAARLERREVLLVEHRRRRAAALLAGQIRRPLIRAGEVRLAVRGTRRRERRHV